MVFAIVAKVIRGVCNESYLINNLNTVQRVSRFEEDLEALVRLLLTAFYGRPM